MAFLYEVEVTAGATGAENGGDYYLTNPIDLMYQRVARDTDVDDADIIYNPKSISGYTDILFKS